MTQIELRSRIGPDGMLSLQIPIGPEDANQEVVVTVRPAEEPPASTRPKMSREEWLRFIDETAGHWEGEPLVRPEQGQYEQREAWE